MLVLHQFEISPFCDKVRRILHVKGEPYEVREVPAARAPMLVPRMNKTGKLPTIEHDGRFIGDSTDIAHYLEERFPEPPLVPSDPRERALCHILEDWADESLYFYEMTLRFTIRHNADRFIPMLLQNDPPWLRPVAERAVRTVIRLTTRAQGMGRKSTEQLRLDVRRHIEAVEDLLGGGDWLIGKRLSLADISVFAQLSCIAQTDEGQDILDDHEPVVRWLARVDETTARPG